MRLALALLLFALLPVFASAGTFSACGTLSTGDYYTQTANITASTSPCVTVAASNTVVDCNFFGLHGSPIPLDGILVNSGLSNVTIKNCYFQNYTRSIRTSSNNVVIENNDFFNGTSTGTTVAAVSASGITGTTVNANKANFHVLLATTFAFVLGPAANVSNNTVNVSTAGTSNGAVLVDFGNGNSSTVRNNTFNVIGGSTAATLFSASTSMGFSLIENNTFNGTIINGFTSASTISLGSAFSTAFRQNNVSVDGSLAIIGGTDPLLEANFIGGHVSTLSGGPSLTKGTIRNNTIIVGRTAIDANSNTMVQSNVIKTTAPTSSSFVGIELGGSLGNVTAHNNTIQDSTGGTGISYSVSSCSNCSMTSNVMKNLSSTPVSINGPAPTFRNNLIESTATLSFTPTGLLNIEQLTLNYTNVNTTVSINTTSNIQLAFVNPGSNADPSNSFKNISEYASISNTSAGSYWELAVYYESTGKIGADSLRMYKRVGSNWHNVSDVGGFLAFQNVPSARYVWVNVTNLSVFAPMGFGDTTRPKITNVSAINQNDTSATITWNTDESSNTSVNYGTTLSLGTTSGVDDLVTFHSRVLYGLSADTRYFYNVTSCDSAGNCNTTGNSSQLPFNFSTLPSGSTGGSTDTDGDGLTDLEEVNVYGTSASNSDTDGDGFLDGQEVAVGSNPLDALSYARVSVVKIAPVFEAWDLVLFFALAVVILIYWLLFHARKARKRRRP
jgi:hypothetical protein